MLWNASSIEGYSIAGLNGSLGSVIDLLFEDTTWATRWLVVDTGNWLSGRKVLLPVSALGKPDPSLRQINVKLTMKQVENSPGIETDRSVSRQMEVNIYAVYGLDPYWGGGLYPLSNAIAMPFLAPLPPHKLEIDTRGIEEAPVSPGDPRLRSVHSVTGYHIHASDGEIGHVEDFLFDDDGWNIRYLDIATRNWWPGKRVLIYPRLVSEIDWADRLIRLGVTRQTVKDSPPYDRLKTVDGAYAEKFQAYYTGF